MEHIEWIFSGIGVVIISGMIGIFKKKNKKQENCDVLEVRDDSIFISENPPDGVSILVGTSFEKSWTIKNNGNIIWSGRYLECVEDVPEFFYPQKRRVNIPKLNPGEKFTLKVKYFAKVEGNYFSQWKMFDENGRMIFPKKKGLGVYVRVVKNKPFV